MHFALSNVSQACLLVRFPGNALRWRRAGRGFLLSRASSLRECGKQGRAEGELDCNAVATATSANLTESSGAELALQSCLRLDQGVWAFL